MTAQRNHYSSDQICGDTVLIKIQAYLFHQTRMKRTTEKHSCNMSSAMKGETSALSPGQIFLLEGQIWPTGLFLLTTDLYRSLLPHKDKKLDLTRISIKINTGIYKDELHKQKN